jgi:hypothetical protein
MKNKIWLQILSEMLTELGYSAEHVAAAIRALNVTPAAKGQHLLTPRQLCDLLHVSRTSLWRLQLPSISVGKRKRYNLDDVVELLTRRNATGAQQSNGATGVAPNMERLPMSNPNTSTAEGLQPNNGQPKNTNDISIKTRRNRDAN